MSQSHPDLIRMAVFSYKENNLKEHLSKKIILLNSNKIYRKSCQTCLLTIRLFIFSSALRAIFAAKYYQYVSYTPLRSAKNKGLRSIGYALWLGPDLPESGWHEFYRSQRSIWHHSTRL